MTRDTPPRANEIILLDKQLLQNCTLLLDYYLEDALRKMLFAQRNEFFLDTPLFLAINLSFV